MKNIIIGGFSGFINGLLGSGGGTIIVPALEALKNIETHKAHATAISIILPVSIISTAIYLFKGAVDLEAAFYVALGSIPGSLLGAKLLKKLSSPLLNKLFGFVLIAAALRMMLS